MDIDRVNKCLEAISKLVAYKKTLVEKYKGTRATLYIRTEINTLNNISELLYDIATDLQYLEKESRELKDENQNLKEEVEINENAFNVANRLYLEAINIKVEEPVIISEAELMKGLKERASKRIQSL